MDLSQLALDTGASIDAKAPGHSRARWRKREPHSFMMRIEKNQKCIVNDRLANRIDFVQRSAVEQEADAAHPSGVPFLLRHFPSIRPQPENIALHRAAYISLWTIRINPPTLKEFAPMEIGMVPAEMDQLAREIKQRPAGIVEIPVNPARGVVLGISVIVAILRTPKLVAAADHGDTLREQQRRQKVPLLPLP